MESWFYNGNYPSKIWWLITFEPLKQKQSCISHMKVLVCGIHSYCTQWCGCILTFYYIYLKLALMLHKTANINFIMSTTVLQTLKQSRTSQDMVSLDLIKIWFVYKSLKLLFLVSSHYQSTPWICHFGVTTLETWSKLFWNTFKGKFKYFLCIFKGPSRNNKRNFWITPSSILQTNRFSFAPH